MYDHCMIKYFVTRSFRGRCHWVYLSTRQSIERISCRCLSLCYSGCWMSSVQNRWRLMCLVWWWSLKTERLVRWCPIKNCVTRWWVWCLPVMRYMHHARLVSRSSRGSNLCVLQPIVCCCISWFKFYNFVQFQQQFVFQCRCLSYPHPHRRR